MKNNFLNDGSGFAFCETLKRNQDLVKLILEKNSIKVKYTDEIKLKLVENVNLATQKRLPEAREEMIDLLIKDQEQLKAGDKNFNFGKPAFTQPYRKSMCWLRRAKGKIRERYV